jgi:tRNA uridine 5-carbamoylmethylation protein Kti12
MKLHNTIIYLIGVPAVGKYTVGKELARLTGARLVENHLINYPVFSIIGYDGTDSFPFPKEAWRHIKVIQKSVLAVIRDLCPPEASFVFTNVLGANDSGDRACFRRIERVAKHRGAKFVPVWLTCDAETIRRRKNAPERRARFKDIDLTNIQWWLEEFELLKVNHPNALTLDSSGPSATQTAKRILKHVREVDNRG